MAKIIRGGTSPPHFCHKKEVKIMTGTTKAIWGAAALVTGVTILTGAIVYDATSRKIRDEILYYKYGYCGKDKAKEMLEAMKKVEKIQEREERRQRNGTRNH